MPLVIYIVIGFLVGGPIGMILFPIAVAFVLWLFLCAIDLLN